MKKLLALLLVLAMVFSMMVMLTACSEDEDDDAKTSNEDDDDDKKDKDDKDDEDKEDPAPAEGIVGTWEGTVDLAPTMNMIYEAIGLGEYFSLSSFEVVMIFTFDAEGNYTNTFDLDSYKEAVEGAVVEWTAGVTKLIEDQEMTVEEWEAEQGMTVEEYVEENLKDSMNPEGLEQDGTYVLDGDKLYMDEDEGYFTVDLSDNRFEMTAYSGTDDEGMFDLMLKGVVFKRQ